LHRVTSELALEEKRLGPEALLEYRRNLPKLGENTLAETEGEACGNCYERFTTNTLVKLRQNKLVLCQACNSILYFAEKAMAGQS
jgi:predicted  nucleic acid-binding Zn-ribbon protein